LWALVEIHQALKENTGLEELNVKANDIEVDAEEILCEIVSHKPVFALIFD
jgi:hypothetical protein